MSEWQEKLAAGITALGIINSVLQSPAVQQTIPTNEPSSSQGQTTEAKCDPLAEKSKEPSVEEKYGIPSEEMQQLGDSQDKSNDEKRDQIDTDTIADNQPTTSDPPSDLPSQSESNSNADLANEMGSETPSPSSQTEPQESMPESNSNA